MAEPSRLRPGDDSGNEDGGVEVMDTSDNVVSVNEMDGGIEVSDAMVPATGGEEDSMAVDGQNATEMPAKEDKGKGKAIEEVVEEKTFCFMDLPTELRLEIYRACLTRPYKILLSKAMDPPPEPPESSDRDEILDSESEVLEAAEAAESARDRRAYISHFQNLRAARTPRNRTGLMIGRAARAGLMGNPMNSLTRPAAPRRRQSRTIRFSSGIPGTSSVSVASSSNGNDVYSASMSLPLNTTRPNSARRSRPPQDNDENATKAPKKDDDPLIVSILRLSKDIYKEARSVLYSENVFDLSIDTAAPTLAALHQRSRRLIRHAELEIPSYTEIQDKFSEVVRLSLRYCTDLRKLVIHTPFCLPGSDGNGNGNGQSNSNTQIWAQGFDILRWLPQTCEVVLEGTKNAEIDEVVGKHLRLAKTLSPVSYSYRTLIGEGLARY